MSKGVALLSLVGGTTANATSLDSRSGVLPGRDPSETDRGAMALAIQDEKQEAIIQKWLDQSDHKFVEWLNKLPFERPDVGWGLILGDCVLVESWTTRDGQVTRRPTEQAVVLAKVGAATLIDGLLIVTSLSPMCQALMGKGVAGDTVSWSSDQETEHARILASFWLPQKIRKYHQEPSTSGEAEVSD
ncbi:MAG: hypothetical protein Q7K33_00395 [Candidatus Berkelbacteria bacterium]|nr:hypothetical protein [Candidatus Berkelbacteria bacterium]